MDAITQALAAIERLKLLGPGAVTGRLPADPAYGPPRPSLGGYAADPGMTGLLAPPAPAPAPASGAGPTGLLSAPPSPGAAPPVGNPPPMLPPPQPISPMVGAPQPISPLVTGGKLPELPAGGMAQQGGKGFWDFLADPSVSRGLMEMGMRLMAASAPSTDPRSGSLGFGLSQGLGGFMKGQDDVKAEQRQAENDAINRLYKQATIDAMTAPDGKAPETREVYVNGRKQVVQWDGSQWVPVGGLGPAVRVSGGAGGGGGPGTAPGGSLGLYKGKEEQNKAIAFGSYIDRALPTIKAVTAAGQQPDWFARNVAGNLPFGLGNFALPPEARNFMQAEKEIAAAVLRKETGAAFTDDELADVRARYIPQPGDDQGTIDQKMRALDQIRRSYWIQSGLPETQWSAYSGADPSAGITQPSGGTVTPPAGQGGPPVDAGAYPEGATYDGPEGTFIVKDGEWVEQ